MIKYNMWLLKVRWLLFTYSKLFLSKILFIKNSPVVSVVALIEKDQKLLSIDLSYYSGFGLPGGLVDDHESLEGALIREVKEETGLTVTDHTYLGSVSTSFKATPCITVVYRVTTTGKTTTSVEGDLYWLPAAELHKKLAYSSAQKVLEKFVI